MRVKYLILAYFTWYTVGCAASFFGSEESVDGQLSCRSCILRRLHSYPGDDFKTYDQVAFLTSHNSYASIEDGWFSVWGANQKESLSQQLKSGISSLMLDIWSYAPQGKELDVYLWHRDPNNSLLSVISGGAWARLRTLRDNFQDIVGCLKRDRNRIITIFFESHILSGGVPALAALDRSLGVLGIEDHTFHPHKKWHQTSQGEVYWNVKRKGWPTLGWLRHHNLRLIMFASERYGASFIHSSSLAYTWDYVLETVYGNASIDPETFCDLRMESSGNRNVVYKKTGGRPLLLMNHFPLLPLNLGAWAKPFSPYLYPDEGEQGKESLKYHIQKMKDRFGKRPNFVAIDYALGARISPDEGFLKLVEELKD